uniref:Hes family bHLH transcription factor 6 n=1 Tax=Neogobius melanostomus TaxID=47308 RepID=A0A8C6TGR8_9GOBI
MAPVRNNSSGLGRRDRGAIGSDRKVRTAFTHTIILYTYFIIQHIKVKCTPLHVSTKTRKPLVEKKRRARINESLLELKSLIAETDVKMENAEVLEMTVKRVESILQGGSVNPRAVNREACERFAAGYVQCMHDVHTFVSNCPGTEPSLTTELLNHLLDSMPLNNKDRLRLLVSASMAELPNWSLYSDLESLAPSTPSSDDLCSDLEESEQSHEFSCEESDAQCLSSYSFNSFKPMWRPW